MSGFTISPLELVGIAGAALLIFAVATWLHVRFWTRRLWHELPYASLERIATPDGSAFDLRRIPSSAPRGNPDPNVQQPPVLIVHGLAANHRNDDLDDEASLARHLARSGRDVWLITLRSGRGDLSWAEARNAHFTAMVENDIPQAVAAVLERTGTKRLDYVGFSMGGMLAYASLGTTVPVEQIRRVVIVGSPALVRLPVLPFVRGLPGWIAPMVPFRFLSRLYSPAVEWFTTPIHRIPINPDNVQPGKLRRTMVMMLEDVPAALNRELASWAFSDGRIRVHGTDALDNVARLQLPVRFFAGAADHVAPARSVRAAFEAWGSSDKDFVLLGTAHGYVADYGHGDLAIGRHAATEVFTPIERFLATDHA